MHCFILWFSNNLYTDHFILYCRNKYLQLRLDFGWPGLLPPLPPTDSVLWRFNFIHHQFLCARPANPGRAERYLPHEPRPRRLLGRSGRLRPHRRRKKPAYPHPLGNDGKLCRQRFWRSSRPASRQIKTRPGFQFAKRRDRINQTIQETRILVRDRHEEGRRQEKVTSNE